MTDVWDADAGVHADVPDGDVREMGVRDMGFPPPPPCNTLDRCGSDCARCPMNPPDGTYACAGSALPAAQSCELTCAAIHTRPINGVCSCAGNTRIPQPLPPQPSGAESNRNAYGGAVTLSDGRLLVITGESPPSVGRSNDVLEYDYPTGTWMRRSSPVPAVAQMGRAYFVTAVVPSDANRPERVYLIGGCQSSTDCRVLKLDAATMTWSAAALPPPRAVRNSAAGATGCDGKIYLFGGNDTNVVLRSEVEVYDPAIDSFSVALAQPKPDGTPGGGRVGATAVLSRADCSIYVIGGRDAANNLVNAVQAFDTSPQQTGWRTVPAGPRPHWYAAAAARTVPSANGLLTRLHVFGGSDGAPSALQSSSALPPSGAWEVEAPMPTDREGLMATFGKDRRFYVIGGYRTGVTHTAVVEAYCPDDRSWR